MAASEKAQGHQLAVGVDGAGSFSSFVQTGSEINSDPICSSAGCTQYDHPSKDLGYKINYAVPNFGADQDMINTKVSAGIAEK